MRTVHSGAKGMLRGRALYLLAALVALLIWGSALVAQAATITVCANGCDHTSIQAAINAATAGNTINVAAGTYAEVITVDKENLILAGAPGATITVAETVTGISIAANGIQVSGFTIAGPHTAPYTSHDWKAAGYQSTAGIQVLANVTGVSITNNQIRDVRTGIQTLPGSGATINGNTVNNTKGSILVRGQTTTATGNTPGPDGNEWDIVIMPSLYGAPAVETALLPLQNDLAAYGLAVMALSGNNGGMTILDRRFGDSNRSHASIIAGATPDIADDFGIGNGLGNPRQPYGLIQDGITAVAPGGIVNVAAGTYTENVNVNKSVTLNGAQAGISVGVRTAGGGSESNVAGLLTVAAADVTVDGFTLTNPDTTSSSIAALLVNSTGSNAHILNNFVQNVGNTGLVNKNVQGIYLTNGPDGITIEKNQIQHILNGNKSVKGIYLGHTGSSGDSSTNVVIQENSISDVKTNGSGGGAYGILVNMAPSVNNLRVIDNTITDVYGKWTHAIGLEGPTPNAVVLNNQFSGIAAVGTDKGRTAR